MDDALLDFQNENVPVYRSNGIDWTARDHYLSEEESPPTKRCQKSATDRAYNPKKKVGSGQSSVRRQSTRTRQDDRMTPNTRCSSASRPISEEAPRCKFRQRRQRWPPPISMDPELLAWIHSLTAETKDVKRRRKVASWNDNIGIPVATASANTTRQVSNSQVLARASISQGSVHDTTANDHAPLQEPTVDALYSPGHSLTTGQVKQEVLDLGNLADTSQDQSAIAEEGEGERSTNLPRRTQMEGQEIQDLLMRSRQIGHELEQSLFDMEQLEQEFIHKREQLEQEVIHKRQHQRRHHETLPEGMNEVGRCNRKG